MTITYIPNRSNFVEKKLLYVHSLESLTPSRQGKEARLMAVGGIIHNRFVHTLVDQMAEARQFKGLLLVT